jgi:hypothetical protein
MLNLTLRDAKLSSTKCQISIRPMLMSYIALVESKKDYSVDAEKSKTYLTDQMQLKK